MDNTSNTHQLRAYIANCKQGDLDLGQLYTKLMSLWSELVSLTKVPVGTCNGYRCGATSKIFAINEEGEAH